MHRSHGFDPDHAVKEFGFQFLTLRIIGLQLHHPGYHCQVILNPVMNFGQ